MRRRSLTAARDQQFAAPIAAEYEVGGKGVALQKPTLE